MQAEQYSKSACISNVWQLFWFYNKTLNVKIPLLISIGDIKNTSSLSFLQFTPVSVVGQ